MISVDTNLVVRLLTRDDELQYRKARQVFESEQVFIADTVVQETEWVLRFAYHFSAEDISAAFTRLFGLKSIHLTVPAVISNAIEWHQKGLGFSDALHLAQSQQCERLVTFDKQFVARAKNLAECRVVAP